jgi:hypothetical protein
MHSLQENKFFLPLRAKADSKNVTSIRRPQPMKISLILHALPHSLTPLTHHQICCRLGPPRSTPALPQVTWALPDAVGCHCCHLPLLAAIKLECILKFDWNAF